MILRAWRGVTRFDAADDYIEHLRSETFPAIKELPGHQRASINRRNVENGVEFLILTEWDSMDAIRQFAGEELEKAVVPAVAEAMMQEYDDQVRHFEVV